MKLGLGAPLHGGIDVPSEPRHIPRQGVPVLALVDRLDMLQEFPVVGRRVFVESRLPAVETHVIRVGDQKGHAALLGDPAELLLPEADIPMAHEDKQREVLRQGIGQLDIAAFRRPVLDEKGEDRPHAVRLRLEGVRVEGRCVVFDVQMVGFFEVVIHPGSAEARAIPFFQIPVDPFGFFPEDLLGLEDVAPVVNAVQANLEALIHKQAAQHPIGRVVLGHEIEGRAETHALLELHQLMASALAYGPRHVVGEYQRKALAVGPARPAFGSFTGFGVDRPAIPVS